MTLFRTTPFYHQTIERFVVAFGQLFTGVTIQKKDVNGNKLQSYEAPIEYAPRNKWISRLREQNDFTAPQVKMTLPRMAFELSDIKYAPERKIGVNGVYAIGNINGMRGKIYPPTPYDVTFSFYVATKDSNDGFQILEQILPYFQPYMTLTYEILPEYQITKDVPVTLVSYQDEDNYDGSPDEPRIEIQTFTFSAQMDFFGPTIISDALIKEVIIKMGQSFIFPITTTPPKTNITLDSIVSPRTASVNGVYTITDTVTEML